MSSLEDNYHFIIWQSGPLAESGYSRCRCTKRQAAARVAALRRKGNEARYYIQIEEFDKQYKVMHMDGTGTKFLIPKRDIEERGG